jgi:hypothetical protein
VADQSYIEYPAGQQLMSLGRGLFLWWVEALWFLEEADAALFIV